MSETRLYCAKCGTDLVDYIVEAGKTKVWWCPGCKQGRSITSEMVGEAPTPQLSEPLQRCCNDPSCCNNEELEKAVPSQADGAGLRERIAQVHYEMSSTGDEPSWEQYWEKLPENQRKWELADIESLYQLFQAELSPLRAALERIRDHDGCSCQCVGDPNCCEKVGEHCPGCIARAALDRMEK